MPRTVFRQLLAEMKVWLRKDVLPVVRGQHRHAQGAARQDWKRRSLSRRGFPPGSHRALEELARAESEDEFPHLLSRHDLLAQEYFQKRGSVISVHALCNFYRDMLVRKILNHVENHMEAEGMGGTSRPLLLSRVRGASAGRSRLSASTPFMCSFMEMIPAAPLILIRLFDRSMISLERAGLFPKNGRATAVKTSWRGSRTEWRREIVEELCDGRQGEAARAGTPGGFASTRRRCAPCRGNDTHGVEHAGILPWRPPRHVDGCWASASCTRAGFSFRFRG